MGAPSQLGGGSEVARSVAFEEEEVTLLGRDQDASLVLADGDRSMIAEAPIEREPLLAHVDAGPVAVALARDRRLDGRGRGGFFPRDAARLLVESCRGRELLVDGIPVGLGMEVSPAPTACGGSTSSTFSFDNTLSSTPTHRRAPTGDYQGMLQRGEGRRCEDSRHALASPDDVVVWACSTLGAERQKSV